MRGDALISALVDTGPVASATHWSRATPLTCAGWRSSGRHAAVRAEPVIPYSHPSTSPGQYARSGRGADEQEDKPMEDVAVISRSGGVMIGALGPGESKTFRMPRRNTIGASASQLGVRPLGRVAPPPTAQRQISVRSQVIDALVGAGGGFPGKGARAGGIDRGPFLIGWQANSSALEVELDGQEVQRYAQSVEVISGHPPWTGHVTISPSELSTEVLATDGEASQAAPGTVTVGNGEVTFRLGMPLEATGLVPSAITVIVASDAATVFYDQENVGAFLGDGYRVAVYDTVAAEWIGLGDYRWAAGSRWPTRPGCSILGRLQVKITGPGVPAASASSRSSSGRE